MRLVKIFFAIFFVATSLSSCYRMPTENEYSTIPTVNNPDVTRASGGSGLPGMSY